MAETVNWFYDDETKRGSVTVEFDCDQHGKTEAALVKALLAQAMQQLSRSRIALSMDDSAIDAWAAQIKGDRPSGSSSSSSSPPP